MITSARITGYDGSRLVLVPDKPLERELLRKGINLCEIRLWDGRSISPEQRKKVYALIRDISAWSGHEPEELKEYFKWNFCSIDGRDCFSLSDVDMTTARQFITYLIEFCFYNNVPTASSSLERADDIYQYLYMCIEYRKCAVCNAHADIHHVDRIGMGGNRDEVIHEGMRAIALCREHHQIAHNNEKEFFAENKIYGIKLDAYLCKKLRLKHSGEEKNEILSLPID